MKILNNKIVLFSYIIFLLITKDFCYADNRIVLHLRHASDKLQDEVKKHYESQSETSLNEQSPSQVNQTLIRAELKKYLAPHLSGFIAFYGGYSDISNPDGLISFPLRHSSQKLYIAVTPQINLVKVKQNTISHKEFITKQRNPTKLYLFEKKEDEAKQSYWDVKEIPIPKDLKIDPVTLIILSNPNNLVIPEGHFLATKNAQLVLPEIYVVGSQDKEEVILKNLDIKQYFEPIEVEQKPVGDTTMQKLIKNL